MVEGTALEMRHTGNRIEGSNPSLSANAMRDDVLPSSFDRRKSLHSPNFSEGFVDLANRTTV